MKPEVKQDLLNVLKGFKESFYNYDPDAIMEWSNHIIHSASVMQDDYTIRLAVTVYSIGKIMAKGKVRRYPQESWNEFETTIRDELDCAIDFLEKDDYKKYDKCLVRMQKAVMRLDNSFKEYFGQVIDKAKLKKGAKIYEHGVSLKRIADLFGINEWDLRDYAGKTRILERARERSKVKERLKRAREFFK